VQQPEENEIDEKNQDTPVVLPTGAEVAEAALMEDLDSDPTPQVSGSRMRLGVVMTLLGGMAWGFSGTCSKFLMETYGIDPLWLVSVRQLFASFIFLGVSFARNRHFVSEIVANRSDVARILVAALCGTMLNSISYLKAVDATDSGTATVLQTLSIVIVLAYVCITLRRPPRKRELLGMVLALGGTILIATHGDFSGIHMPADGLFWGLMCAVGAAIMGVVAKPVLARYGSLPVNGVQMLVVGVVMSLFVQPWNNIPALDLKGIIFLIITVVVGTFCAYAFYFKGVSILGAYKAGLLGTIEPVTATVASVLWLGAAFSGAELIGFAMIIVMVFLTS
jgi:drug/metabolite transporter (DMT)-like permease